MNRLEKYGLTDLDYAKLLDRQDGKCAVCQKDGSLVIDHDHKTGAVRGLLCGRCNMGLGQFSDDVDLLSSAMRYLTQAAPDLWSEPLQEFYANDEFNCCSKGEFNCNSEGTI